MSVLNWCVFGSVSRLVTAGLAAQAQHRSLDSEEVLQTQAALLQDDAPYAFAKLFATDQERPRLVPRILAMRWHALAAACFAKVIAEVLSLVPALVIDPLTDPSVPISTAIAALVALLCSLPLSSLCAHHSLHAATQLGLFIRAGLLYALAEHGLQAPLESLAASLSSGRMCTLAAADVDAVAAAVSLVPTAAAVPVQLTVATGLLVYSLSWAAVPGIAVLAIAVPVQRRLSRLSRALASRYAGHTDGRLSMLSEALAGMRAVKYFCWEQQFESRVDGLRRQELRHKQRAALVSAANGVVMAAGPLLAAVASFCTFAAVTGSQVSAGTAFSVLVLFNAVRVPLVVLPMLVSSFASSSAGLARAKDVLRTESLAKLQMQPGSTADGSAPLVEMREAAFTWAPAAAPGADRAHSPGSSADVELLVPGLHAAVDGSAAPLAIRNCSCTIPADGCTVVVGASAAGKTAWLLALLGELHCAQGRVVSTLRQCSVAFCGQQAWLPHCSLQDAILFGQPMDTDLYRTVLWACALQHDVDAWPDAHATLLGERGTALSGGQAARVALARAVYKMLSPHARHSSNQARCLIADDVLAALDQDVRQQVFERVFGRRGLLAEAQVGRVLATHDLHYTVEADQLLVLEQGAMTCAGTPLTVLQALAEQTDASGTRPSSPWRALLMTALTAQRTVSPGLEAGNGLEGDAPASAPALDIRGPRAVGAVSGRLYMLYAKYLGWHLISVCVTAAATAQAMRVLSDWWLGQWAAGAGVAAQFSQLQAGSVYLGISALSLGLVAIFQVGWAFASIAAAHSLHAAMVHALLHAPMHWLNTTPVGRVMAILGSDMDVIDRKLPADVTQMLTMVATLVAAVIVQAVLLPVSIPASAIAAAVYIWLQQRFRPVGRESFRLELSYRGLPMQQLTEMLRGRVVIRAFGAQASQLTALMRTLRRQMIFTLTSRMLHRWLGVRLDALGAVYVTCICAIALLARATQPASLLGLAVTQALSLSGLLTWLVKEVAEIEARMASVERAAQLLQLPHEGEPAQLAAADDAQLGAAMQQPDTSLGLDVRELCFAHHAAAPQVLQEVTLACRAGSCTMVVGRTGSGKSSLLQAIVAGHPFRSGAIHLLAGDQAWDTRRLPLHQLRQAVLLLPQDVVLFQGTVRTNLDPTGLIPREEVAAAAAAVGLQQSGVTLEQAVGTGGEGFSLGQCQLLAAARALLRRPAPKIVLLDEPSSSLDLLAEEQLLRGLRQGLPACTLVIVAHRLQAALHIAEQVVVLQDGVVTEMGAKDELLSDSASSLHGFMQPGANAKCAALVA